MDCIIKSQRQRKPEEWGKLDLHLIANHKKLSYRNLQGRGPETSLCWGLQVIFTLCKNLQHWQLSCTSYLVFAHCFGICKAFLLHKAKGMSSEWELSFPLNHKEDCNSKKLTKCKNDSCWTWNGIATVFTHTLMLSLLAGTVIHLTVSFYLQMPTYRSKELGPTVKLKQAFCLWPF